LDANEECPDAGSEIRLASSTSLFRPIWGNGHFCRSIKEDVEKLSLKDFAVLVR
jgi:hypothetical protein